MSELVDIFEGAYVLCICEGGSEMAIMNMLIDEKYLIFKREDLIREKVHPRMKTKEIEQKFLNKSYAKPLVILRIIDSSKEKFPLGKAYIDRYVVKECLTKPEIEILVILDADILNEFNKVKSKIKPSSFCKAKLKHKDIKDKDFMTNYFDISRLLKVLKEYKRVNKNDHLTIYDLLNKR
jgi:hypothetical protein